MGMEFPLVTAARRAFLGKAVDTYSRSLAGSPAEELLSLRGINADTADLFGLGYVEEPLEGHETYRGWLSIPYLTHSGVTAIRFRRISGEGVKFLQEPGSLTPLYNPKDLHRPESYISICEGEPDTWVMSALVGVPAVGIAGVDQWSNNSKVWPRLFQDYDKVFVVMDPDDSGQKVAKDICRRIPNSVNIILPDDVNATYLEHGTDVILEMMGLI